MSAFLNQTASSPIGRSSPPKTPATRTTPGSLSDDITRKLPNGEWTVLPYDPLNEGKIIDNKMKLYKNEEKISQRQFRVLE